MYEFSAHAARCSECGARIPKGGPCLVSRNKESRVKKKVCSQECRETFDDKFWGGLVHAKEERRKRRS